MTEIVDAGISRTDIRIADDRGNGAVGDVRLNAIRAIRCVNVTINHQWEGSTGYISEADAGRLYDAIARSSFSDDESYALFLILDSLARSLNGRDPIINYFRERLLPVYREWHAANPGEVHPDLALPNGARGEASALPDDRSAIDANEVVR